MSKHTRTIKNTSSVVLGPLKPGHSMLIETEKDGTPKDKFWRRRVLDAKIDGCVEVVSSKKRETK